MAHKGDKIIIGITTGDPNGIGVEVIVKSLANRDILELFTPVIFGNGDMLKEVADRLGIEDFAIERIASVSEASAGNINIVEVSDVQFNRTPGKASQEGGRFAVAALEAASEAISKGEVDLLVTAPIDKKSVQSDQFHFPGHTEYLEEKFRLGEGNALMIMTDGSLRVSLVTTHMPLKEVASHITKENILRKIKDFNTALKMDFGCERPKIAVLSLNPHCGDGGVLGKEEIDEIIPALEESRKEGIMAFGPISADGLFGSGSYRNYDGILAMYHDQGLAPFKALASGGGVNFTAGLDIIRTSPAHGTAYDKAGKGMADETSMREAIYAAMDIARHRVNYLDASENPLEIHTPVQKAPKRKNNPIPSDQPKESTED